MSMLAGSNGTRQAVQAAHCIPSHHNSFDSIITAMGCGLHDRDVSCLFVVMIEGQFCSVLPEESAVLTPLCTHALINRLLACSVIWLCVCLQICICMQAPLGFFSLYKVFFSTVALFVC